MPRSRAQRRVPEPQDALATLPAFRRSLPHCEETECAVLGAFLLAPSYLGTVGEELHPGCFYLERHREVFEAMAEVGPTDLDLRTLQSRLENRGSFERVGGMAYLAGLDLHLPDLGRTPLYAQRLRHLAVRRAAIEQGVWMVQEAANQTTDVETLLAGLEATRDRLDREQAIADAYVPMLQVMGGSEPDETRSGFRTGFTLLDHYLRLVPGELIVLAGRPGHGKSAFAGALALRVAKRGRSVGFVTLEMTLREVGQRWLASESDVPHREIARGRFETFADAEAVVDAQNRLAQLPIWVDDSPAQTLESIAARARRLRASQALDLLVIDYAGLIDMPRAERYQLSVAQVSKRLKRLAKELGVPVIALVQLNREVERRSSRIPVLSDLKDSGTWEQDANKVLFVVRQELYHPEGTPGHAEHAGQAEVIIAKNRGGQTNKVATLTFDAEYVRFRDLPIHRSTAA